MYVEVDLTRAVRSVNVSYQRHCELRTRHIMTSSFIRTSLGVMSKTNVIDLSFGEM